MPFFFLSTPILIKFNKAFINFVKLNICNILTYILRYFPVAHKLLEYLYNKEVVNTENRDAIEILQLFIVSLKNNYFSSALS